MKVGIRAEQWSKLAYYLLILFAVVMPFSLAVSTVISVLVIIVWLASGDFGHKFEEIKRNQVALAVVAFVALNVVGLIWTEDLKWGFHILGKQWKLLLMPVFLTSMRKEHAKDYITAFLASMTIALVVSYLHELQVVGYTIMSRVSYNVFLALAIYIILDELLLFDQLSKIKKVIYPFLAAAMTVNMFMTDGRAGQVACFALISLLIFQYFNKFRLRALAACILILPLIFTLSYTYSSSFHTRTVNSVEGLLHFKVDHPSDEVIRLLFYINSFYVFKAHPLIGVGTGDFNKEYEKINAVNSPDVPATVNPHDNYLLVLCQFGIIGLIVFLCIFYYQIRYAAASRDQLRRLRLALPFLFLVIMLFETYLLGYFTSMLFVYFSAVLYKDCDAD